jgi:hypothetical protein
LRRYDGAVLQHDLSRPATAVDIALLAAALLSAVCLSACDSKPPGWESLLAAGITQEFPDYSVSMVPGQLLVNRPGLASKTVDVNEIAQFCRRGPRDCEYAKDQMLIELRAPLPVR